MHLDERRLAAVLPGRAKMSFRAPSMSTVAKVVGRLKGQKHDRNKKVLANVLTYTLSLLLNVSGRAVLKTLVVDATAFIDKVSSQIQTDPFSVRFWCEKGHSFDYHKPGKHASCMAVCRHRLRSRRTEEA